MRDKQFKEKDRLKNNWRDRKLLKDRLKNNWRYRKLLKNRLKNNWRDGKLRNINFRDRRIVLPLHYHQGN